MPDSDHNLTRLAVHIVRDIEDALAAQASQGLPPLLDEGDDQCVECGQYFTATKRDRLAICRGCR